MILIPLVQCMSSGLLSSGALLNAFGAIVLGAPVGLKYWLSTIYWSSLMSLFTEWPICVTYGAIAGYSVGMFASAVFVQLLRRKVHVKDD
ncbi:hypothetical protein BHE74_00000680 [Ensete ventricosum]|nr:hypothetical protein BHE74_00000680 [Ensete ventricosum]RZR77109.1 hypothetical protein BHM03_00002098 [Ensete ventricosum]